MFDLEPTNLFEKGDLEGLYLPNTVFQWHTGGQAARMPLEAFITLLYKP